MIHVVLVRPEIPQNTGNIARTCAATGCRLHLVRPLGFAVTDRHLKRAGMDYWHETDLVYHDSLDAFLEAHGREPLWLTTGRGGRRPDQAPLGPDAWLVFGAESSGLPPELLAARPDRRLTLPMRAGTRSLNLASATAALVYEALRQQDWPGLAFPAQSAGKVGNPPENPST